MRKPVHPVAVIPEDQFVPLFHKLYLQTGEYIGDGGEALERFEARLELFYDALKVYRLDFIEEAFKRCASAGKFPSVNDVKAQYRDIWTRRQKPPTVIEVSEEDRIRNENLFAEVQSLARDKSMPGSGA